MLAVSSPSSKKGPTNLAWAHLTPPPTPRLHALGYNGAMFLGFVQSAAASAVSQMLDMRVGVQPRPSIEIDTAASAVSVDTPFGTFGGLSSQGVDAFLGIKYADVAERFAPASLAKKHAGVYNATMYGKPCWQVPPFFFTGDANKCFAEDCLFANIHRPSAANSTERLPVMFFIHGGSMKFGSGGAACPGKGGGVDGGFFVDMFDGKTLAREHGVVVVSINCSPARRTRQPHSCPCLLAAPAIHVTLTSCIFARLQTGWTPSASLRARSWRARTAARAAPTGSAIRSPRSRGWRRRSPPSAAIRTA